MRNKIFAIINIVWGSLDFLVQSVLLIAVYPKLHQLYTDMGVQVSFATRYYPAISMVFMAFLIYVIFVGVKLLKSKTPSESLFKQNLVFSIVLLVSSGFFTAFSIMSLINPIYNLTKSF